MPPHRGYSAGHPWYYLLGGAIPTLKQIRAYACASATKNGYRGYLADEINAAHARQEPKRSAALRKIKAKVIAGLCDDISRYREVVRELRAYRQRNPLNESPLISADVHMSTSLKFAHIYNGFVHLNTLDALPDQQLDLFGM